jgi:UDP:flavonoid glycosyltransferase YjiC (YdhE family)
MRVLLATTANNGHFGPMLPFAAACQRAGREVLVAAPESFAGAVERAGHRHWSCPDIDPAAWSTLPPNVHVERWVPQQDVLADAAAMVCHGGTGTVLGGPEAAVPMVVVPQFADQPDNADRVAAVGAGIVVGGGEAAPATAGEVRAAVNGVLTEPSYREAAGAIAGEIAALPPVDEAVGFLARLTPSGT